VSQAMAARTAAMGRARIRTTLASVLLAPEDALELLAALTVPWRAVGGADDYALAAGVAEAVRGLGDLDVAPGGHTSPLEAPEVVAAALDSVLDAVRSRPGSQD
jgi:pimeloyl-ACP methyl ester carboxylesterase